MDIKILMAQTYGWSLHDINQTDVIDLLHFINRATVGTKRGNGRGMKKMFCDDMSWL